LNKLITENGYISLDNLYLFIRINLKKSILLSAFGAILFIVYFSIKTPSYATELSFYTNYNNSSQSSLLSPFLGGISDLSDQALQFSIEEYLSSDSFLQTIVQDEYVIDGQTITLADYWGKNYNQYLSLNPLNTILLINRNIMFITDLSESEKRFSYSKAILSNKIFHSENRKSGLQTITVKVNKHPNLSIQISKNIFLAILNYNNVINNIKANEKSIFIEKRIQEVGLELKNSEEAMLSFMINNKDLKSPTLLLQKNRLQRNINAFTQVYLSLVEQYELARIDSKDNTNSIFHLDESFLQTSRADLSLIKGCLFIFISIFITHLSVVLFFDRKNLFH